MRVLFDQGTPVPLRNYLPEHKIATAAEMGWSTLSNGELLDAAEREFDLLVTTDQALRTQQSLSKRKIAILVLPFASWPRLEPNAETIASRIAQSCARARMSKLIWSRRSCEQSSAYSGSVSPDPPIAAGKSLSLGNPSLIGRMVSA